MSSANLMQASAQWRDRPADERFWTLKDLYDATSASCAGSQVKTIPIAALKATSTDDEVTLMGPRGGVPAHLTHYAFEQLCGTIQAPAGYLRSLPTDIAAGAVNAGLIKAASRGLGDRDMLFHQNGRLSLRAMLSDRYDRVWDKDVAAAAMRLGEAGWRVPAGLAYGHDDPRNRPATAADILPGQINISPGAMITPSGLYASDHDCFIFLVAPDRVIEDGRGGALMRGVFMRNSEVGDASLSMTFFLMQAVCGNHIVWNATGVHEVRVRHIKGRGVGQTARKAFSEFSMQMRRYHDAAGTEEKQITAARTKVLGAKKEDVITALVEYTKRHSIPLSRETLVAGYDTAAEHEDWYGPPNTVWAQVAGLTHASQGKGFADSRNEVDRAAGRLMSMADAF